MSDTQALPTSQLDGSTRGLDLSVMNDLSQFTEDTGGLSENAYPENLIS